MDKTFKLSKHKYLEFELDTNRERLSCSYYNLFNFQLSMSEKRDHAGFKFEFSPFKLFRLSVQVYDHRHWDDDSDNWCEHLGS